MEKPSIKKYNKAILILLGLFVIMVSLYPYAKNYFDKTLLIIYVWSFLAIGCTVLILTIRALLLAIKETHDELDNHSLNRD